jgi:hypothetical protein
MTLRSFPSDQYDQSRQFLLDRRCERNHPKRHRTKPLTKRISARKNAKAMHAKLYQKIAQRRFKEAARAYWAGEASGHP